MRGEPLTCPARYSVIAALLLICGGCTTVQNIVPVERSAPNVPVPMSTRFLGQATVYRSVTGESLEVVRDASAGIAIVKLPDGSVTVLSEEIAGSEGRYRDRRMTVWENDGVVLLWVDGKLFFSGKVTE